MCASLWVIHEHHSNVLVNKTDTTIDVFDVDYWDDVNELMSCDSMIGATQQLV